MGEEKEVQQGRGNLQQEVLLELQLLGLKLEQGQKKRYNTGPGSLHFLLFGDGEQQGQEEEAVPYLNAPAAEEEIPITQNAPNVDM